MSVNLSYLGGAGWQFFDNNGIPLAGGLIYTYFAGTTTPLATFTDNTGLIGNTNPIVLDAAGRPPHQIWVQNNTPAKFIINTSTNVTIRTEDNISYNAFQEFLNVKDFGATGDGVTDDTVSINNAVAAAFTQNAILVFPNGSYLTTSSIQNIHNIRKMGPGAIKRGSNLFYVDIDSSHSNMLYVDPTGNLINDGFSSLFPISTVQKAFDTLITYGPVLNGTWNVQMAAGTYPNPASLSLKSENPITIAGPLVGHPNVPIAIVDGTGLTSSVGLTFLNFTNVNLSNVLLKNWNYLGNGDGLICLTNSIVNTINVHTMGCATGGIIVASESYATIDGGIVDGSSIVNSFGIFVDQNSSAVIGKIGSVAGDNVIVKNCNSGIRISRNSYTQIFFANLISNSFGLLTTNSSFSEYFSTVFTSNGVAVQVEAGSNTAQTGLGNVFTTNTKDYVNLSAVDELSNLNIYFDKPTQHWLYGGNGATTLLNAANAKFQYRGDATVSAITYNAADKFIVDLATSANGNLVLSGADANSAGVAFRSPAGTSGSIRYAFTGSTFTFDVNGTSSYSLSTTDYRPLDDGVKNLGAPGNRWNTVYATVGAINTSDAREKDYVNELTDIEKKVASKCKSLIRSFKFKDAIKSKNEDARIHFGVIAQDIKDAFESNGLDPFRYGLFCYDEWEETQEIKDQDGNITQEYKAPGERFGIRYDELLAFIIGAL